MLPHCSVEPLELFHRAVRQVRRLYGLTPVSYGRFPGEIIPVIPVMGEVVRWKDNVVVKGVVRDLLDAQKSYNYLKSQEVEIIALTPKAPLMAEEGTIPKEYEKDWTNFTRNPTKVLKYRSKNLQGETTTNKPQFLQMEANTTWAQQAARESVNDLKEITGIFDTALGADRTELSGKAIIAKQLTADAGQYVFSGNLQLSVNRFPDAKTKHFEKEKREIRERKENRTRKNPAKNNEKTHLNLCP